MATLNTDNSSACFQVLEQVLRNSTLPAHKQQQLWDQATQHNVHNDNFHNMPASLARQVPRSMAAFTMPSMTGSTADFFSSGNPLQRSVSAMPSWPSPSEDQANGYALYSQSAAMRKQHSLQPMHEVTDFSTDCMVEWEPKDYINACNLNSPPLSLCTTPDSTRLHVAQLTQDSQWASLDGSISPSTPSTGLMTPATIDGSMSRQASFNPQYVDQVSMLRVQSNSSCAFPPLLNVHDIEDESFSISLPFDHVESKLSPLSSSPFVGSSNEVFFSHAQVNVSASPRASALGLSQQQNQKQKHTSDLAEDMRRSSSTSSTSSTSSSTSSASESDASYASTSSTNSRPLKRKRAATALPARKLAPRQHTPSDAPSSTPSTIALTRVVSSDGSSKHVAPISKTPYIRPSHPKIKCAFCNERPEGFRGTHELERHVQRAHAPTKKGYICVDHSADQKFLASCKHCNAQKVYGAYYNAAAHLRRAHFHPRKRGGRKGKDGERRGGIGGGDDPPMDVLKMYWIKEVEVSAGGDVKPVVTSSQPQADADADADANADAKTWQPEAGLVEPGLAEHSSSVEENDVSSAFEAPSVFEYECYPPSAADMNVDMNVLEFQQYMEQNAGAFMANADACSYDDPMAQFSAYPNMYDLSYLPQ